MTIPTPLSRLIVPASAVGPLLFLGSFLPVLHLGHHINAWEFWQQF